MDVLKAQSSKQHVGKRRQDSPTMPRREKGESVPQPQGIERIKRAILYQFHFSELKDHAKNWELVMAAVSYNYF